MKKQSFGGKTCLYITSKSLEGCKVGDPYYDDDGNFRGNIISTEEENGRVKSIITDFDIEKLPTI